MSTLLVGELAACAGVTTPAIRYYERLGLLTPAARAASGYRRFSERAVGELRFIGKAQALGFSLEEIGEIVRLTRTGGTACGRVLSLARQHLAAVEERIRGLERFRDQLAAELGKWDGRSAPTCRGLCQIIEAADVDTSSPAAFEATDTIHYRRRGRAAAMLERQFSK